MATFLAQGVAPIQLNDPLNQMAKIYQIKGAQQEQSEREQTMDERNRLRQFLSGKPDLSSPEVLNQLTTGFGASGLAYGTKLLDIDKERRAQKAAQFKLVQDKTTYFQNALANVNTPDDARTWTAAVYSDPDLGPVFRGMGMTAEQAVSRVPVDPAQFETWKRGAALGAQEFIKLNAPKTFTQDVGGSTRILSVPGLGGAATVVPGSDVTKTLTPGEAKPVVTNVDVGNEILVQSYDPVTRQVTVLERRAKGLTPGEAKPTVTQIDIGGATITQEYDPRTRTTRVLETRPKTLTPEQARAASQEKDKVAHTTTDEAGNVTLYNMFGQVIGARDASGAPVAIKGKPSATFERTQAQRQQLSRDLDTAIFELKDAVKEGGLIDQSTGSGVGRAVDVGARFIGQATKGDIAIGKLKPIADIVLKMVPRFEGPQSDKDTQSYKEAAGQLADPTLPRDIRKAAAQTIIRLMENRKGQFVTQGMAAEGAGGGGGVDASNPLLAPPAGR